VINVGRFESGDLSEVIYSVGMQRQGVQAAIKPIHAALT
jgi:hypothetical protein